MSLYNYLAKARVVEEEIRMNLPHERVQTLYNLVKEIGPDRYYEWWRQNRELALQYMQLPSSRRRAKKWENHPDILLIQLAALQLSYATSRFLHQARQIGEIVDGGSYRDFHCTIAGALMETCSTPYFFHFPFVDFDNPFR